MSKRVLSILLSVFAVISNKYCIIYAEEEPDQPDIIEETADPEVAELPAEEVQTKNTEEVIVEEEPAEAAGRTVIQTINGKRYFFKTDGAPEKGWKSRKGSLYFSDRKTAVMAADTKTVDGTTRALSFKRYLAV